MFINTKINIGFHWSLVHFTFRCSFIAASMTAVNPPFLSLASTLTDCSSKQNTKFLYSTTTKKEVTRVKIRIKLSTASIGFLKFSWFLCTLRHQCCWELFVLCSHKLTVLYCLHRLPHFSTYERENSALFRSHHSVKNRRWNLSQKLYPDAKAQARRQKDTTIYLLACTYLRCSQKKFVQVVVWPGTQRKCNITCKRKFQGDKTDDSKLWNRKSA